MKFDDFQLAELAREVAMNVRTLPEILVDWEIPLEEYEKDIDPNPFYKRTLAQYVIEWNSAGATKDRVKLRAQALVEQALRPLGIRLLDLKENLSSQVELGKFVAQLGHLGDTKDKINQAERFTITINMGTEKKVVIDQPKAPIEPPKSPEATALKVLNEP